MWVHLPHVYGQIDIADVYCAVDAELVLMCILLLMFMMAYGVSICISGHAVDHY